MNPSIFSRLNIPSNRFRIHSDLMNESGSPVALESIKSKSNLFDDGFANHTAWSEYIELKPRDTYPSRSPEMQLSGGVNFAVNDKRVGALFRCGIGIPGFPPIRRLIKPIWEPISPVEAVKVSTPDTICIWSRGAVCWQEGSGCLNPRH